MNNRTFEELLRKAGLSKKEFATLVEMNSNSVTNWNKTDKVPQWVKSWLLLYIENQKCQRLKTLIKENVCDEVVKA